MSIDMLLACLQMPDAMGDKLSDFDKAQILSRCGEAYRLLESQRAELAKLREVLAAAKNALPHINDVTNAAHEAEQRLQRAIESADTTHQPGS